MILGKEIYQRFIYFLDFEMMYEHTGSLLLKRLHAHNDTQK